MIMSELSNFLCFLVEHTLVSKTLKAKPSALILSSGAHYSSVKFGSLNIAWKAFQNNIKYGFQLICAKNPTSQSLDIVMWKTATTHFFARDLGKSLYKGAFSFFSSILF